MQQILHFLRLHRIPVTLIVILAFILAAPFNVGATRASPLLPWSVAGLCVLIAAYAWWVRDRFDARFALVMAAVFAAPRLYFNIVDGGTYTLRTAAIASYLLLHVVLLIGPWSRFSSAVREWYKHRRHLGVTAFLLALLHASLVFSLYFGRDLDRMWQIVFVFFGSTALIVMAVLAISSWDWFQKNVSWKLWSVIHAAVLAIFLYELQYVINLWRTYGVSRPVWVIPSLTAFIVFWIIVAPWGFAPRLFKVLNGWKQLHVLVYIAYASLVLHVYFGRAEAQGPWARWTVLVLLAMVAGSHAAGWIRNWQERRHLAFGIRHLGDWVEVCHMTDLVPGQGRRVDIHGLPVALFLHDGRVLAFFGYCAHQKGPLWQGQIIQGYLTCPWHGWQYSVKDGKGPEGFSVPFYETKVENGRVYVRVKKGEECRGYGCGACKCCA